MATLCRNEKGFTLVKSDCLHPAEKNTIIQDIQLWLEEAVIGLQLCPFAKRPFQQETIRYRVLGMLSKAEILTALQAELQQLRETPASALETTLLILPDGYPNFLDFNDLLYDANALLEREELVGEIQIASFHPEYQFGGTRPEDVENFTNRAPYPVLHLLREDSLTEALSSVHDPDQIYLRNIKTMEELGLEGIKAIWNKFS